LRSSVPNGDRWVHEIKFDGYRVQARLGAGVPSFLTRIHLRHRRAQTHRRAPVK
jgi:bifunctional non-homologous end joining protein LigD